MKCQQTCPATPARIVEHPLAVFLSRAAAIFLTGAILWGAMWPSNVMTAANLSFADKLWHFFAFWVWGAIVALGWPARPWMALASAISIGAAIELVQPMVGRNGDFADLGADVLGSALGVWSTHRLMSGFASRTLGQKIEPSA